MVNFGGALAHASKKQKRQRQSMKPPLKASLVGGPVPEDFEGGNDRADTRTEKIRQKTKLGRFLDFIEPYIIFLIVTNAVMMGIGTFDFVTENDKVFEIFEEVDLAFLIIFTVEVTLASAHYFRLDRVKSIKCSKIEFLPMSNEEDKERKMNLPWILFDAVVVILSWAFNHLSIIRSFRILRALRLISKVDSMKKVIRGLFAVGPRMGMVAFMLGILFIVFGVAFTMLFRDVEFEEEIEYFGTFHGSILTLFQIMTFDNWQQIARQTMAEIPWSWTLFIPWVLISGFVIMNLIVAIICESLVTMNDEDDGEESFGGEYLALETRSTIMTNVNINMDYDLVLLHDTVAEILKDQEELLVAVEEVKKIIREILNGREGDELKKIKSDLMNITGLLS